MKCRTNFATSPIVIFGIGLAGRGLAWLQDWLETALAGGTVCAAWQREPEPVYRGLSARDDDHCAL